MRLDAQALDYAKELGMTPASRRKLQLNVARTYRTLEDDVAAAARAAWKRREAIDGTVVEVQDGEVVEDGEGFFGTDRQDLKSGYWVWVARRRGDQPPV